MVEETKAVAESAGALGALGIDLKLFLAQLLNFGVVFFVMWKWVYVPLLKTLDARATKIEQGLKDAAAAGGAKAAAEHERDKAIGAARQEAKRIIEEAAKLAETERVAAAQKTKAEVERIVTAGKERLVNEQAAMMADVRAQAAELVTLVAEKVLAEKMDSAADKKLIDAALKQI